MNVGVNSAINIWHYDHLPGEIKEIMQLNAISDCDLDWVALMPEIYKDMWINWLEGPAFGCSDVKRYPIDTIGYTLVLGYHS